ncbi:hypothetical protein C8R41DRAFT_865463 [Lentinula lateritia]|uniref:Bacteriophage T5 Orf172 DNA-binding domain-containing protein n=1 Tax=Lentinula lateritia TaxID=40482 RepID=A0ABQ8VLV2_9AGAR|nr:hypothetical protein C8R41DRAFT_865463 [Lentinula lateritia]
MARRRTHQLQSLYRQRISRLISPSDGPGWIYVYIDNGNEFKIGMMKNFERRQREWDRNCPCLDRIWFKPILAANRRRAESVVHILLEIQLSGTRREICFCWSSQGYSEEDLGSSVAEGSDDLKFILRYDRLSILYNSDYV